MPEDPNTLTLHDYPIGLWITGAVMIVFSLVFFFVNPASIAWLGVMVILFILFFLLPNALTITADKISQTLRLNYRSLLRTKTKEIPLRDIASIDLEASHSSDGTTYRIALRCRDGSTIPFRSYYSSGIGAKRKKIEQLQAFLGLPGNDGSLQSGFEAVFQMVQGQFQAGTGSAVEEHLTDGVHWQMQTAVVNTSTINRWFSPDAQFPGGFLFLAQKAARQKLLQGGLMKGVEKMLFPPLLKMYGFGPQDIPDVEYATILSPLDPHLEPHFAAFTSDPAEAERRLNPWVVQPLEDWAIREPLKAFQTGNPFGQVIILFSPRGVYICNMGKIASDAVEKLTALGVQLVKSLK